MNVNCAGLRARREGARITYIEEDYAMAALLAYLDAGTGSILLQALMGGFAGLMVLSKVAWKSLLNRQPKEGETKVA